MQLGVRGLNHLIASETWAVERLRKHAGAQLLVAAGPFSVRLGIDHSGFFHLTSAASEPDVRLTLPADVVVRAFVERDKLFSLIKLEGSVDVAESLAFVFRNLKWDVEADLAGVIGDIPAYRLARIGRSLASALHQGVAKGVENFREYVVEESALVVRRDDLATFGNAVNTLRDDVARLEKRLSKF